MHFHRSLVAAALVGFGAATTHPGEGNGHGAAVTTATALAAGIPSAVYEGIAAAHSSATPAVHEGVAAASSIATSAIHHGMATTATAAAIVHETASAPVAHPPAATGEVAPPAEAQVKTHVVQVGSGGEFVFSPTNVIAQPGDLVQFQFYPKNHSVVQSTFDNPCVPIQNIMANKTDAFFSGFMPTAANATTQLTYTIRVADTKPMWYYCSQAKHCQDGMVAAINAPSSGNKTVETFKGLAAVAVENLSPGQVPGAAAPSAAPSSGAPPAGEGAATGTGGLVASPTSPSEPAQQTTNAAPGRLSGVGRQSVLGLGLGGLAAFLVL